MTVIPKNGGRPLRYGYRSTDGSSAASLSELRERLGGRVRAHMVDANAKRAAVLVPILAASDGLQLLCFERTHEVLEHKGEICLPGGSIDRDDAGPVEAALREAHEELGIATQDVDVLGLLDDVHTTVSNYVITPVVGFIATPREVVPDALEVARPIVVPLSALLARGVESYELRAPDGTLRTIYAYHIGSDRIWGATARIIHGLLALWFGADGDNE
jgi:8-oxo-dGTP pyrophosphatase MutT (NUDIX family)